MVVMGKDSDGMYFILTTNGITVRKTEVSDFLSDEDNKNLFSMRMRADREKRKLREKASKGEISQKEYLAKIKEIDDNVPEYEAKFIYELFAHDGRKIASFDKEEDMLNTLKEITKMNNGIDVSEYQAR